MTEQWNDLIQILTENPWNAVFLILGILLLEVILSFDNAAVLATMVKDLPEEQQAKALRYGILGAYIFRGVALILVDYILDIWWLKPIGGLYLLWMAISHFAQSNKEHSEEEAEEVQKSLLYRMTVGYIGVFWSTVIAVEFMDIVFSIDNIFAVVAYTPNLFLICAGVFIGILAMRYVAKYFVVLMEKYPYLEKSAFIVIGILGIKLCFSVIVHFGEKNFKQGELRLVNQTNQSTLITVNLASQKTNAEGDLEISIKKELALNETYSLELKNVSEDIKKMHLEPERDLVFTVDNKHKFVDIHFSENGVSRKYRNSGDTVKVVFKNNNPFKWIESEEFDMYLSVLTLLIFFLPIVSVQLKGRKKD